MDRIYNVETKHEVRCLLKGRMGGTLRFDGIIRNGKKFVKVNSHCEASGVILFITYWEDGNDVPVQRSSNCSNAERATGKIADYLLLVGSSARREKAECQERVESEAKESGETMTQVREMAVEYGLTAKSREFEREKITCSQDSAMYARKFYGDDLLAYESSFIILLDAGHRVKGWAKISQGGVLSTGVDIRLVAMYAVQSLAASVIFVHNHPSGNKMPSSCDKKLTEKMRKGLQLLGIKLLDSIIITEDDYYGMNDEGDACMIV